jgi:hypothetical protein
MEKEEHAQGSVAQLHCSLLETHLQKNAERRTKLHGHRASRRKANAGGVPEVHPFL